MKKGTSENPEKVKYSANTVIAEKIVKVIIILLLLFIFVCIATPVINNLYLYRFSAQFEKTSLPTLNSTELEIISKCGDVRDDGSFSYVSALLIEAPDATEEELLNFYRTKEFTKASSSSDDINIEVIPMSSPSFNSSFCPGVTLSFDKQGENGYENCYAVVIYDGGYSSPLDFRSYMAVASDSKI